jgi:hypothetical protein
MGEEVYSMDTRIEEEHEIQYLRMVSIVRYSQPCNYRRNPYWGPRKTGGLGMRESESERKSSRREETRESRSLRASWSSQYLQKKLTIGASDCWQNLSTVQQSA